jgi:hypothetical protein
MSGTAATMRATSSCSAAVSERMRGLEAEALALRHDRHAVVAQGAGDEDGVARPRPVAGDVHALRHHADAGGGDEDAVALALLHHLGVAGDDRHAGLARRLRHRVDDALEVGEREAFFQDEAGREVQRLGARHGDVVDRAVHRQAADVAAGEEQRRDDVRVGRHHHAPALHGEAGVVVGGAQPVVVEGGEEQLLDQLRHRPPAAAVGHVHAAVLEIDGADVAFAYVVHVVTASL